MHRGWHLAAICALSFGAAANAWPWFAQDRMPPGDFAGYAAQVQYVRDALLEHGRVPLWCVRCCGGASQFTANLKEYVLFPLAVALDPVAATKLGYLVLRVLGGLGLYWIAVRWFAAPMAGIVAGYAGAFSAIPNHHLWLTDLALATALLPPLLVAAVEVVQRGSRAWIAALGALSAALLVNNWVYALPVPFAIAALMLGRLRHEPPDRPWWQRAGVPRIAAALGITLALAASQLAWTAADARHHALLPRSVIEEARLDYIARSPFLLVNRDNFLAGWLKGHQPPGLDITVWDRGGSYVGIAVLATLLVAWPALRRQPALLTWARFGLGISLFVYWLSLGPRTLLWQLAQTFHASAAAEAWTRRAMLAASALCLAGAASVAVARRTRPSSWLARRCMAGPLWTSVALVAPTVAVWSALALVLPPLQMQRSPGHFFEALPFWLSLAFAAGLAALGRSIARPGVAIAVVAAIAVATAVDFAPSARTFAAGVPMAGLESAAALMRDLGSGDETLRVGIPRDYEPQISWILAQSPIGNARNWLGWQAGTYWHEYFGRAASDYDKAARDQRSRTVFFPRIELMQLARVRYFLLTSRAALPAPWRPREGWSELDLSELREGNLQLWELPEVAPELPAVVPMAQGYRSYARIDDDAAARATLNQLALGTATNSLLITASRVSWPAPPRDPPGPPPFPVAYRRPAPEHIALEADAGSEPALIFVSESHHPWWRVAVDGEPGTLLRAQLTFMAVPVPPGAHRVDLRFEPPIWLRLLDRASQLAWVALLCGAAIAWWRSRRSAPSRRAWST